MNCIIDFVKKFGVHDVMALISVNDVVALNI
jgi:hypothetical protein